MDKYIIITTFCENEDIANQIVDSLLVKKLVAASQISKVHSKYWWNNTLEECDEYKLEFRTIDTLFKEVEAEIKRLHNYEVAEISSYAIDSANYEFKKWINDSLNNQDN